MPRNRFPSFRLITALLVLLLPLAAREDAVADLINGSAEWDYSRAETSSSGTGGSSTSKSAIFMQRYSLDTNLRLFPTITVTGGAMWQKENDAVETNGLRQSSAVTNLRPYADVTLKVDSLVVAAGFSRRREDSSAPAEGTTTVDDYHALATWRPTRFFSGTMQFNHTARTGSGTGLADSTEDRAALGLNFMPSRELDLHYQGLYGGTADHLDDLRVRQLTNTVRANYGSQFFDRRVTIYSSLSVSRQDVQTIPGGAGGNVPVRVDQLATALYAATDTPSTGALQGSPGLNNGDILASAGIDSLGVPVPSVGETRPRNIGFDFINATDVNAIYLFVNRELPQAIAGYYSWDIYVTQDDPRSATASWTKSATVPAAQFGPFLNGYRFEIDFPTVRGRGIKVVTNPLTAVAAASVPTFANPEQIFVTEAQALLVKSAQEAAGTTSQTSAAGRTDVKVRLVDGLYYNGSLFFSRAGSTGFTRYTFSNGFTGDRRLTGYLTASAQAAREDGREPDGRREAYVYSLSLKATPLPTLTDSLTYSGRNESVDGRKSSIQAVNLYNSAQLYRGVSLILSGGGSIASSDTSGETKNVTWLGGLSLVPHRTLTVNLNYTGTVTETTVGSRNSQRFDASAAWRPFATVYLFGSFGVTGGDRTDTLVNYGLNWAPFPDGTLQVTFNYNENLDSRDNSKQRLISPGLIWKATSWSQLEGTYVLTRSSSDIQSSHSQIATVTYRILF